MLLLEDPAVMAVWDAATIADDGDCIRLYYLASQLQGQHSCPAVSAVCLGRIRR